MNQEKKLKLFISYSHKDNRNEEQTHIDHFKSHVKPLKEMGLLEDWSDREVLSGEEFQSAIRENLEDADIICLFLSENYLSSSACLEEKETAMRLRQQKAVSVIPIILSPCKWKEDKELRRLLALPTDGKPISSFENHNEGWLIVHNEIKKVIEQKTRLRQLTLTNEFSKFLHDTELLKKAHSQKEEVLLEEIFVFPELSKFNDVGEFEEKISSEDLSKDLDEHCKLLIAGENQSGKTSLCKKLFLQLRERGLVPIYLSDKKHQYEGLMKNRIQKEFNRQYKGLDFKEIETQRIVPLVDDFHFAKDKERHISFLSKYCYQILIVDDIYNFNIMDETLISSFTRFKVNEFSPSLRHKLMKKWSCLVDKEDGLIQDVCSDNEKYKKLDQRMDFIDRALGKAFGKGIMPAYPFFILSVIATYETFGKPLDREITSQGYCYQALIYLYLRKQGVKNDDVDTYVNFLTELAFYLFKESRTELTKTEFEEFMKSYTEEFYFPVKQKVFMNCIRRAQIVSIDSFSSLSFTYPYLFYFFTAKYLAEHMEENQERITSIIQNLHKDENAYITVFIAHHSKKIEFVDEIILNARGFFEKHKPATLSRENLRFFDRQVDNVVKAVLPPPTVTPEQERERRLKVKGEIEEMDERQDYEKEFDDDELAREIRRSIKTVEVMGSIAKNRAGSIKKEKLVEILEESMRVHFRILTSFFEIIRDEEVQNDIVNLISTRLELIQENTKSLSIDKKEDFAKQIFWNINFFSVYGSIFKIIHSIGSEKLQKVIEDVCDSENTPAAFLVKHGVLMWYVKNLQVDEISNRIAKKDLSKIAEGILKFMVASFASTHRVNYRDLSKIEQKLRIPRSRLSLKSIRDN